MAGTSVTDSRTLPASEQPLDQVFASLVERHGRALYRVAYHVTGNDPDARDVVQESFFRAYQRWESFDGRADVATWLHRIVVNCALDLLRAIRSRPDRRRAHPLGDIEGVLRSGDVGPERIAASAESRRDLDRALDTLTPMERAAFSLRHFDGRGIDDIAATLGVSSAAAKQHVFRAVRKLRVALARHRSGR